MKLRPAFFILLFFSISYVYAQTSAYEKGLMAFDVKDFKTVVKQLKPYAQKGNCLAQFAVGFSYMYGDGIKNDSLAIYWLSQSAEQKQFRAMGPLAVAYFMAGTDKDHLIKSYMWAMLAVEYDPMQQMTTTRVLVKSYMKPADIEQAEKLIAEYKKKWKDKPNCDLVTH